MEHSGLVPCWGEPGEGVSWGQPWEGQDELQRAVEDDGVKAAVKAAVAGPEEGE